METLQKKLKLKSFLERRLSPAFPGTLGYHTSHQHVGTCTQSLLINYHGKRSSEGQRLHF